VAKRKPNPYADASVRPIFEQVKQRTARAVRRLTLFGSVLASGPGRLRYFRSTPSPPWTDLADRRRACQPLPPLRGPTRSDDTCGASRCSSGASCPRSASRSCGRGRTARPQVSRGASSTSPTASPRSRTRLGLPATPTIRRPAAAAMGFNLAWSDKGLAAPTGRRRRPAPFGSHSNGEPVGSRGDGRLRHRG
jgi:hypothetical protein